MPASAPFEAVRHDDSQPALQRTSLVRLQLRTHQATVMVQSLQLRIKTAPEHAPTRMRQRTRRSSWTAPVVSQRAMLLPAQSAMRKGCLQVCARCKAC